MAIYKILLCDDSEEIRQTFLEARCPLLYDMTTVPDGETALALIKEVRYDAIVTDYAMPNLNGIEFIERIRESLTNRTTPIFLLSGYLDETLKGKLKTLLIEYYEKPISVQIFFDKINNKFFHNRVIPDYNIEIIELFQSSIEKTLYYFFGSSPMVSTPQLTLDILNPDQFTSYINFVGKKMSGSVAFISTKEFANLTAEQVYGDEYRAIIKTRNHAELMGEFVNQIAGYMKCTFDKIGLLCQITIPSSFSGEGNICSFLDKSWVKFNVKVNDCFAVVACRLIYVDPKYLKMVFANGDIDEDPEIVLWR